MAKIAEEKLDAEKIQLFIKGMLSSSTNSSGEIKLRAVEVARELGMPAQVMGFSFGALAFLLQLPLESREPVVLERFVELAAGVAYNVKVCAYNSRWFTEFKNQFITPLLDVQFERPEVQSGQAPSVGSGFLNANPEVKGRFGEMLVLAMGLLEDTGKCGSLTLKKCVSYSKLKQWGEEWARIGFTTQDRNLIAELMPSLARIATSLGGTSVEVSAQPETPPSESILQKIKHLEGDKARLHREVDGLKTELNAEKNKNNTANSQNNELNRRVQSLLEDIAQHQKTLEDTVNSYNEKLECERAAARARVEAMQEQLTSCQQQAAIFERDVGIQKTRLLDALRPIYTQYCQAQDMPMSEDLSTVYRALMQRIFNEMNSKGFNFN